MHLLEPIGQLLRGCRVPGSQILFLSRIGSQIKYPASAFADSQHLLAPIDDHRHLEQPVLANLLIYSGWVVLGNDEFQLAIANYLPPALVALFAFWRARSNAGPARPELAALGMALSLAAAGLQHFRIAIHPRYFDHNVVYHVVSGLALGLIYVGVRRLRARELPLPR